MEVAYTIGMLLVYDLVEFHTTLHSGQRPRNHLHSQHPTPFRLQPPKESNSIVEAKSIFFFRPYCYFTPIFSVTAIALELRSIRVDQLATQLYAIHN